MSVAWDFDALHLDLSRAAIDASHWKPALQRLSAAVGAVGTLLLPPATPRFAAVSTDAIGEATDRYFREGWNTRDLRYRGLRQMLQRGVTVDLDFATEEDLRRSDYYNDFLGRHGLRWFAGIATTAGSDLWVVSIQRSIAQGPFLAGEQDQLVRLRGPLAAAAAVSRELGLARARGLAEAFELLGSAAVILDWRGEVVLANAVAERTLTRELRIAKRRLTVANPDCGARLCRLVDRVTSMQTAPAPGPPVAVERAGRRPLLIYAVPLVSEALDIFANARALLVVLDPEARPVPPEDALRGAFGMTTAEARLASQLAGGESLETVADALGITKQTARTHLKAVFAKAGTHRQSELVALLARLARGRPEISSV